MLATYNRIALKAFNCGDELHVFMGSNDKAGLEWNQYIGSVIINDFIKQLDEYDGTDFTAYIKDVVPFIQLGLFQSAIGIIRNIEIPGLEQIKEWLVKSLTEGEDRY
jgi:hypothetical protein